MPWPPARQLCGRDSYGVRHRYPTLDGPSHRNRTMAILEPALPLSLLSLPSAISPTTTTITTLLILTILVLLALAIHAIHKDYKSFLALGPGGIPSTPTGYLHQTVLRPFTLHDPLVPPKCPPTLHQPTGFLPATRLPRREGCRPEVRGIAPHRQTTHRGSRTTYKALADVLARLVMTYKDTHGLYADTSCFEKHSVGVFVRPESRVHAHASCNGEVCHAHPSDGSLHLSLHPKDVAVVLERGWGERHPLAREWSWWWRVLRWGRRTVPPGFVIVYAPRAEREVAVVLEIVRAAVGWVSGRCLDSGEKNG